MTNVQLGTIIKTSFMASFILIIFAVLRKLMHAEAADTWLLLAVIASIVFIATAIYEVLTSKKIDQTQKLIWTLALIFFSSITGLIYILIGRKGIASDA